MKEMNKVLNGVRRIVFLDFEGSGYTQEIISIGAIKTILDNKGLIKKSYKPFKIYIKINSKVGDFISELTGISDELLNKEGVKFIDALNSFSRYVGKETTKYFHYGNFDMHMLSNSLKENKIENNLFAQSIFNNSVDFEKILKRYVKSSKNTTISLLDALKVFETNAIKENHNAVNDAINLMNLYNSFLIKKNIVRDEYIKTLKMSNNIPNPYRKVIKKLESNEKVTYKDFLTYIDEEIS